MINPRNVIGAITSLSWMAVGAFFVFWGVNNTWKGIGFLVIAVGIVRGAYLIQRWKKDPTH
ncbi:MAG: hypothetical protein FWD57_11035 [Polyangiaceae bacterium]|nr:hypothetical protein [Polyangiaceae bacterium]